MGTPMSYTGLIQKYGANNGVFASIVAATVDINGGTIDGTSIGATTPAAGAFTTGTFSGSVTLNTASASVRVTSGADVTTLLDIDFPGVATQVGQIRIFRNTVSGNARSFVVNSPGTTTSVFSVIANTGEVNCGGTLVVTGIASFAAGAVTTPSIARTGDLNTGFWFPAADTVAVSAGGTEAMRWTASGVTTALPLTTDGGLQTFLANDSAGAGFRYVVVPNA